jgi:hypothetical protein
MLHVPAAFVVPGVSEEFVLIAYARY